MNKYKKRLIIFIAIQIILTIIHVALDTPATSRETWVEEAGWHYWAGLAFGVFVVVYALSLRCKKCGAGQVFRSLWVYDLRWPQDKCWKCNSEV